MKQPIDELIERVANTLQGMTLDKRIPKDTKDCMVTLITDLEEALEEMI